ncbi:MAG: PorV/PorQ family protein [bacterium]
MIIGRSLRSRLNRLLLFGLVCGLCLLSVGVASAAEGDEGSAAGILLRMDPGASSSGFGSAYTARSGSGLGIHFNPAGLGVQEHTTGTFTHLQLFADIDYNHLSMVTPVFNDRAGIGISLTSLNYGDIQRAEVVNQNPRTSGLGQFGASDIASSASMGLNLTDSLKLGLTGTYIRQQIAGYSASTGTGDFGLQYHLTPEDFVLGAAARNIGGELKFIQEEDPLPLEYSTGIFYSDPIRGGQDVVNIGGDMVFPTDADAYVAAGLEYGFFRTLFLRAGFNGSQEAGDGFTFGGGVHDHRFTINYSYVSLGDLGDQQRLTLSYNFGTLETGSEEEPSIRRRMKEPRSDTIQKRRKRDRLEKELKSSANQPELKSPSGESWRSSFTAGKKAYRSGNYREARRHFLAAYRINPGHLETLLWLGTIEWYLGMDEKAKSRMNEVLSIDPDNAVARKNLKRMR